jgi:hemoglobin
MVRSFYARVREDALLGPIFASRITDWERHQVRMTEFWSSLLRGTHAYHGTPASAHAALPGFSSDMFARWMVLFQDTTAAQPNRRLEKRANRIAERVVQSLWFGYQLKRPVRAPREDARGGA